MNKRRYDSLDIQEQTNKWALVVLLILGALLRFYGLEAQSLWNDELSSMFRSSYPDLEEVIHKGVMPDIHPPGYQTLMYFVEKYFGDSETVLRAPSAIAGVLSIGAIYMLGKRIYSYKEGLIAAALMAVLWCPIYYSQEARPYSLLLLFSILTTYFWLGLVSSLYKDENPSLHTIIFYVVAAAFVSYLHYFGLYLVALQGLFGGLLLLRRRKALLKLIAVYLLVLLAYAPWIAAVVDQFDNREQSYLMTPSVAIFLEYLKFLFNYSHPLLNWVFALYGFLIIWVFSKGRKAELQSSLPAPPIFVLIVWLMAPIIGIYFISLARGPVFTYRNLIICLPSAYLLLARALTQLPVGKTARIILVTILVCWCLRNLIHSKHYYSTPTKDQFREAVAYVADNEKNYTNQIVFGFSYNKEYFNYYFKKDGSQQRVDLLAGEQRQIPKLAKYIKKNSPDYIWYLENKKADENFILYLKENYTLVSYTPFIHVNVWLFKNH